MKPTLDKVMASFKHTPTASPIPAAKKSLGQNFLQDVNIARKIVEALNIQPGERVIEIGPGPGALTCHLLESGLGRLVLMEKDRHWARHHAQSVGENPYDGKTALFDELVYGDEGRLKVIEGDALAVPWSAFDKPVKIIGNLPYNVASPLMWDIVSQSRGCERAVFMIQKEVGLRLTASPKTKEYGALSVWIQSFCVPQLEFIVPPQVFHPKPKVHSAVVSFNPLSLNPGVDYKALSSLLKMCFQARRKQLGNSLRALPNIEDGFKKANILPTQRPEELSSTDFHRLVMALFPKIH